MSLPIRARLTLWYTTVLSLVLAASAAGFYVLQWRLRLSQLDGNLSRAGALVARLLPIELDEGLAPADAAREALEDIEDPDRWVAVFDADGGHLAGRWEGLPRPGAGGLGEGEGALSAMTSTGGFRLHRARLRHNDVTYYVGAAESLSAIEGELAVLRRALASGMLLALVLAASGGWWIARGALRPVTAMADQASRITGRSPGQRLAAPNPVDELGQLAHSFNDLLARLEAALSQQRRFMADASHELRTPLSIAHTAAEVALARRGRQEDEYRDSLGIVAAQTRRLARIVEDMFLLARADAAGLPLVSGPLYLDELVGDCVKEIGVLAAKAGVRVEWQGPPEVEARGDERLLR